MIRVRFAPSPTGYLHIGNGRTALFNYLFARKNKGSFILRIEDTDKERSKREYEEMIIQDLRWLGLDWDEGPDIGGEYGPYRQSERLSFYEEFAKRLIKEEKAYYCYCSPEELEEMRREQTKRKESPRYDNRCRELSSKKRAEYEKEGRRPVVRFRVPEKRVTFSDLIRQEVSFDASLFGDFIIMKSGGTPAFNFAVVVDDILMKINYVIRGEDHLSNTPRHILLFSALGEKIPNFAHMAMTLGPDGARLSKRHGATSLQELKKESFLPEAVFNYLSLLGWGTTENKEIFTKEELIKAFSLERCKESAAIFDLKKLTWLNGIYLKKKSPEEVVSLSLPYLREKGLITASKEYLKKAIELEGERIKKVSEVPDLISFFLEEEIEYPSDVIKKVLRKEGVKENLLELTSLLEREDDFSIENLEGLVRSFCTQKRIRTKDIFHPLRVAVTGRTVGPGLFETLSLLGKERVIKRLKSLGRRDDVS